MINRHTMLKSAFLLFLVIFLPFSAWAMDSRSLSAEFFLREVPSTIFDNTGWPISEKEKLFLINPGYCSKWMLSKKTDDYILISSLSLDKEEVYLKVYRRDDGSGIVIFGANGVVGCTSELWEFNNKGGIVPLYAVPEPEIDDFFDESFVKPRILSYSSTLCFHENYLQAIPNFWTMSGLVDLPLVKEVFYYWDGKDFAKVLTNPAEDLSKLRDKNNSEDKKQDLQSILESVKAAEEDSSINPEAAILKGDEIKGAAPFDPEKDPSADFSRAGQNAIKADK